MQPQAKQTSDTDDTERRAHIRNWATLDFQRRLASCSSFDQDNEFRPYVLPNRPIHSVPRQRVGVTTTVSNSLEINQTCSTKLGITNVKHLTVFQDGSLDFTHIAGGKNFPVDYNKLLFSKVSGFAAMEDAMAPNANTKETDTIVNVETIPPQNKTAAVEQSGPAPNAQGTVDVTPGKPGVVTFSGVYDDIYGITVMVTHGDGTSTIFPNLRTAFAQVNNQVDASTKIGNRDIGVAVSNIVVDCGGNAAPATPCAACTTPANALARNPPATNT